MTDPTLFPPPPATGALTPRQRAVHQLVRSEPAGITALQAGQLLHEQCRYCTPTMPCRYAQSSGLEVLRALRRRGLVVRRRSGRWQGTGGSAARGHDPAAAEWPEGF